MSDLLKPFEQDAEQLMAKIAAELDEINSEFRNVDNLVETDVNSLISEYQPQIEKAGMDQTRLKQMYRATLKQQRIESLEKAQERLLKLKNDIRRLYPDLRGEANRPTQLPAT